MVQAYKQARVLLMVVALAAIAVGCGGSKSSGGAAAFDMTKAQAALDKIDNYKFSMAMKGAYWDTQLSPLSSLGLDTSNGYTMSGTIITKPQKAADIQLLTMHIIEVGGTDYVATDSAGPFISAPSSGTSMADKMAPATFLGGMMSGFNGAGLRSVGDETKNGVAATHYTAPNSDSVNKQLDSQFDVTGGSWAVDVWVAKDGGYPISIVITATAAGAQAFNFSLDISNINDATNTVVAPTNVQ